MTAQRATWVRRDGADNGTTPKGARLAMGGLLAHDGASALGVRKGVVLDGQGPVVAGAADMSYDVRAHVAVTMASSANGPTIVPNDATVNVPTDPAPGSGSRIDVIWILQHLLTGDGGSQSDNDPEIGVTIGDASGSPSAPAIPAGALSLAEVTVTTGTTATNTLTFTRTHAWTVANGGVIPIFSSGERDAITPFEGCVIWYSPDSQLQTYDGSDWVSVGGSGDERIMVSTADQDILTNTETLLDQWANHGANTDAGQLFTYAAGVLTCVKAGRYWVHVDDLWQSDNGSYRATRVYVDDVLTWEVSSPATSGANRSQPLDKPLVLTAGQEVDIRVKHNTGNTLKIYGDNAYWAAVLRFEYRGA